MYLATRTERADRRWVASWLPNDTPFLRQVEGMSVIVFHGLFPALFVLYASGVLPLWLRRTTPGCSLEGELARSEIG